MVMSAINTLFGTAQSKMESDGTGTQHYSTAFPNNFAALCFDRSEFNRPDFNVDTFLATARRRGASLEQIRDDARVYLKIIQNSMIELINKDYADFVHLSSNLAGLRGAVEKLGVEADEMTSEFEQTASKITSAVEELTTETEEKRRLLTEQRYLEKRIVALSTLERLKRFLSSPNFLSSTDGETDMEKDFEAIQRASYFIEELQSIKNSCTQLKIELHSNFDQALSSVLDHFQKWLEMKFIRSVQTSDRLLLIFSLRGFAACDRLDAAQAIFLAHFVERDLRSCFSALKKQKSSKVEEFKSILDQILVLKNRYRSIFSAASVTSGQMSDFISELDESAWKLSASFLDDCLLTALLSALQDRFSSILIPTDASTFRKAYRFLIAFAEAWSTGNGSNKLLKMVFDKFSLLIYYQLCYHEVTSAIDNCLASPVDVLPSSKNELFSLNFTSFIYDRLRSIWASTDDESVFLPPLMPKFWELTCLIINRYGRHISKFVDSCHNPSESENLLSNGDKSSTPQRSSTPIMPSAIPYSPATTNSLLLYASDLRILEQQICGDLFPQILIQSRVDNNTVSRHLEQCLMETFSALRQNIDRAVADALIPWLTSQVSSQLAAVAEVPRQYRWTRKEAPNQPSPYLSTALDPIRRVSQTSSEKLPNDTTFITDILERVLSNVVSSYTENLKSVFESVEKISSSLNRLKTKGSAATLSGRTGSVPDSMSAVTDEQKIRLQLRLDVGEFEKMVNSLQPPVHCDLSEMKLLVAYNAAGNES